MITALVIRQKSHKFLRCVKPFLWNKKRKYEGILESTRLWGRSPSNVCYVGFINRAHRINRLSEHVE